MPQLYLEHLYGILQLYTWGLFPWHLSHFHEEVCLWVCPKSSLLFWAINFDMFKYKIVRSWSMYLLFGLRITLACEKWFWKYESKIRGLAGSLSCDLVNIPLHVILIVPPFSSPSSPYLVCSSTFTRKFFIYWKRVFSTYIKCQGKILRELCCGYFE